MENQYTVIENNTDPVSFPMVENTATFETAVVTTSSLSPSSPSSSISSCLAACNDNENDSDTNYVDNARLHPGVLQSSNKMAADVIEWCCHKILVEETSLNKLRELFAQLSHYLSLLRSNEECIYLNDRLNLVALVWDALSIRNSHQDLNNKTVEDSASSPSSLPTSAGEISTIHGHTDDDDNNLFSPDWKYEDWKKFEEQFVLVKSSMFCKDNMNKNLVNEISTSETPSITALDTLLRDYNEVLRSIQVQAEIARVYQRLQDLRHGKRTNDRECPHSSFSKQLKNAIDEYICELNNIFRSSDDSSPTSTIPKPLMCFMLQELYQKDNESLLDRLLKHLQRLVMCKENTEFSYHRVQQQFRRMLVHWFALLSPPAVPELLGDMESYVAKREGNVDDDDASSWSGGKGELLGLFEEDEAEATGACNTVFEENFTLVGTQIEIPVQVMTFIESDDTTGTNKLQYMYESGYNQDVAGKTTVSSQPRNHHRHRHSLTSQSTAYVTVESLTMSMSHDLESVASPVPSPPPSSSLPRVSGTKRKEHSEDFCWISVDAEESSVSSCFGLPFRSCESNNNKIEPIAKRARPSVTISDQPSLQ